MEDVRFVNFFLNGTTYWAAIRLVEQFEGAGKNLAGMYVALNGKNLGQVFLLRTGSVAAIGPQTALDTISNYGPTRTQLTLQPNWRPGNILLYVINNNPYYFVPYYGGTETTLTPSMIVTVDALSQKVGFYLIDDPGNAVEVGSASKRAYLDLIGVTIELTAEARKKNVTDEIAVRRGFTIDEPDEINVPLIFEEGSASYYNEADWAIVNSTISSLISDWAVPNSIDTILIWETAESNVKYLNLGVYIISRQELRYITIAYG
jgi:hypothetical protein